MTINRTWRIARPVAGLPCADDFRLEAEAMPVPGEGQVLMRTIYISISPGVRPLMPYAGDEPDVAARGQLPGAGGGSTQEGAGAEPPPNPRRIAVGERMRSGIVPSASPFAGGTVGQVVESRHPAFRPGDYIFGGRYWSDYEVVDGDAALRIDPEDLPIEADLGLVGRSAMTGWVGWKRFCNGKPGETIVVSAATGPVGMVVCQLARRAGLRVIGIASGPEKCAYVTGELGAAACIDRSREDIGEALDRLAPGGVDIYFDNVGGHTRAAVFDRLAPFGRLIVCGMAAEYNGAEPGGLSTGAILSRRLRVEGFVVLDFDEDYAPFRAEMAQLWKAGELSLRQTVFDGLETAPAALAACLSGQSAGGKILVKVSPDTSRGEALP